MTEPILELEIPLNIIKNVSNEETAREKPPLQYERGQNDLIIHGV